MRIGGKSTGEKLRKRARTEKTLLRLKQGEKPIKCPVFLLCKTENFIVQFLRNFSAGDFREWQRRDAIG